MLAAPLATDETPARMRPTSVEIRARVQGFLDVMAFEPSSFVRKGQLLFVIEPGPYEAQRDRAAANLEAAEAGLRRLIAATCVNPCASRARPVCPDANLLHDCAIG